MWFFNPKNVTIGSGIDQNKKYCHIAHLTWEFRVFNDIQGHFLPMGQKDGDFFVLINARAKGNI